MPIDPEPQEAMRFIWDEFEKLRSTMRTKVDKPAVEPAHGGIVLTTPTAIPNLTTTPAVLPFDAGMLALPFLVTQDFANDGLRAERSGIFNITYNGSISHNESNAGRELIITFFIDGAPAGSGNTIAVGRNTPGTNISISGLIEVAPAGVGSLIDVRISSALDVFTSVVVQDQSLFAFSVSVKFEL